VKVRADDHGITLPSRLAGSYDVLFDGEAVWSFTADRNTPRRRGSYVVRWPRAMRSWLHGRADLALRPSSPALEGEEAVAIPIGPVSFGGGREPIRFVDREGLPVVIDKWGIVQRPFAARGSAVTAELAERTREVIEIVREECGLEAWMAFGTLLGAARTGGAIGHDSDSDLLYLSEQPTLAGINLECYAIKRALSRRGLQAMVKSGSFVTVLFPGSDGAPLGIDVYACFYVDGVLHETATLRAPIPRTAILPLRSMEFEGLELPAPADPDVLLAASYGPGWQTPDPSFRHEPDKGTVARFEGWFGNMMTARRGWESWWHDRQELAPVSGLAQRVIDDHPEPVSVLEIGAGNGSDAVWMARHGHRVNAFDFARRSFQEANRVTLEEGLPVRFGPSNLYDLRDALTLAALQLRRPRPARVVMARFVLGSVHPRGLEAFWRLTATTLRGGGRVYLELPAEPSPDGEDPRRHYPLQFAVEIDDVRARLAALGARVVVAERARRPSPDEGRDRPSWHVVAEWS
jgi:SAM-dependent methyltransferase